MMTSPPSLNPDMTMQQILQRCPGAQRALFRRYHIGGCSSCAFQAGETLRELCARNNALDPAEVLEHLQSSHEQDELMMIEPAAVAALRQQGSGPKLLDVRPREEWEAVHIEGAVRMSQETMQEILGRWPREELVVIYDHRGATSLDAAAYFTGQGFKNVRCLRGGIDAWAQQVESDMPRYRLETTSQ